jgi:hypothetical protein
VGTVAAGGCAVGASEGIVLALMMSFRRALLFRGCGNATRSESDIARCHVGRVR